MKPPITIEDALEEIRQMFVNKIFTNVDVSRQNIWNVVSYDFPNKKPFIQVIEQPNFFGDVNNYLIGIDDYYLKYKADKKHVNRLIKGFVLEVENLELRTPHIIKFVKIGQRGFTYKFSNDFATAVKQIYTKCLFTNYNRNHSVLGCEYINCHFGR